MMIDTKARIVAENTEKIEAVTSAFYTALFADLKSLGASVTMDTVRSLTVNDRHIGYTLRVTPMYSGRGRFTMGTFTGGLLVTLHRSSGRYSNNLTWRSKKDGSIKTKEIAEALVQHVAEERASEKRRDETEARRDVLQDDPRYAALRAASVPLPKVYVSEESGYVTLKLSKLTMDEAERVVQLLAELAGSTNEEETPSA